MKTKIVLWGNDKDDQKVLLALALNADENKVELRIIPEADATDDFYNTLMEQWREGETVEFPETTELREQELRLSENLLPEDIKVEKTDIIQRAQTEWTVIVLSAKLYETYRAELATFEDKINQLQNFERETFQDLKNFWDKVQNQIKDKNLQRDQGTQLKEVTNKLFDKLKKLRASQDEEFLAQAQEVFDRFSKRLETLENRIALGGNNFREVFDSLKQLQQDLKQTKMTKDQRNAIWNRVDEAFKKAKDVRFGGGDATTTTAPSANNTGQNTDDRMSKRLEGLDAAIAKMEKSISRDHEELAIHLEKMKTANFDNKLEEQISHAKLKMMESRIESKQEKLDEMNKTRSELLNRQKSIKERDERRQRRKKNDEETSSETEPATTTETVAESEETVAEELDTEDTPPTPEAEILTSDDDDDNNNNDTKTEE